MRPFRDRRHAGQELAKALNYYRHRPNVLVLGLARGGAPVAHAVAETLNLPLDLAIVRKLGVPGHEEYAMGAIAPEGVRVLNTAAIEALSIPDGVIAEALRRESRELTRRQRVYRGTETLPDVRGKKVILVDDGLATGMSMLAAIRSLQRGSPAEIIVGVPVAAPDTARLINREVDAFYALRLPEPFRGVGGWYAQFPQLTDDDLKAYADTGHTTLRQAS
jgi:predicted phosphoribosyltransferase